MTIATISIEKPSFDGGTWESLCPKGLIHRQILSRIPKEATALLTTPVVAIDTAAAGVILGFPKKAGHTELLHKSGEYPSGSLKG